MLVVKLPFTRTAPRASNCSAGLAGVAAKLFTFNNAVIAAGAGMPAVTSVTKPLIRACLSVGSMLPLRFESVPTSQPFPLGCIRNLIGLLRRTASYRVNFSMSDTLAAALLSWYVRTECISEGMAMADKIRTTVMETANSTMLNPAMRRRRVRGCGALLSKIVSSFKGRTSGQAYQGGSKTYYKAVVVPGTMGRN